MKQIIVDLDRLGSYSNTLNSEREDLETIKNNMMNIINALSKCWQGKDSIEFRVKAITYLNSLKGVENSLTNNSNEIRRQLSLYQARIASALSKLG